MKLIDETKVNNAAVNIYGDLTECMEAIAFKKGVMFAQEEIQKQIQKRFYWLMPDGTISNMWDEKTHNMYLTKEDIEKANGDGWNLIEIRII